MTNKSAFAGLRSAPATPSAEVPASPPSPAAIPATTKAPSLIAREGKKALTVYVSKDMSKAVNITARVNDMTTTEAVIEALNAWLVSKGAHPAEG